MATFTTNWALRKPADSDDVDVAADLNANWDIVDAELGAGGVSGWVDIAETTVHDGTTDDAAAINAAITASASGSVIYFRPGLTWAIASPIILKARRFYYGAGNAMGGSTGAAKILALAGFTGGGLMVAEAWYTNATTCDNPVRVQGLELNGGSVAGTRGLILTNFWSRVHDVHVRAMESHGVELNDLTADGVNIITNSASENTIIECRFENIGGDGVHQESNGNPTAIANLDGHISGCFFSTIGGHGVNLGRGAGWVVQNNHMYGVGLNGIRSQNCYATIITGNYLEDMGTADVAAATYTGIALTTVLNGRASIVANNTVSTEQPASPTATRFICFYARAGSGQSRAIAVFTGNTAMFASSTAPTVSRSHAFRFGESTDADGRMLQVEYSGNQIENTTWWENTRVVAAATVDLREVGRSGAYTLTDGATVALDAARARVFKLVALGNRTISVPTNPIDGQGLIIEHTASGGARTLTLTTGSAGAFAFGTDITGLTATTSGTTDYIGAIYDATAARWRILSYTKGF